MMEEGGGSGSLAADWPGENRHWNFSLRPPSSFFSISFSRLVKNFTKRNFIFPSHPPPAFARHGTAGPLPTPGSSSNTYVLITFSLLSLEKSRKRYGGGSNKLFVRRNLLQKSLFGEPFCNANGKCLLGESFFGYVGKSILRPQARCTESRLRFLNTLQIVI